MRKKGVDHKMTHCTLFAYGTSLHLSQVYTGFSILATKRKIRLQQIFHSPSPNAKSFRKGFPPSDLNGCYLILDHRKLLFYDVRDGGEFFPDPLSRCDYYFKRSCPHSGIPEPYRKKVFPLGMNYELYTGGFDRHEFLRLFSPRTIAKYSVKNFLQVSAKYASLRFEPTIRNMCAPPDFSREPKVLFLVRTWNPNRDHLTKEEKEERAEINDTRAKTIEWLRKNLGDRFYGGFSHTEYAKKYYPKALMPEKRLSEKSKYIALLREHPICIATTGLYGSIGWKLAEYVAFSKSIVTENLRYRVPGNFSEGENYLSFETSEQCIEQTMRLVEDHALRREMMEKNRNYYQEYMVPDKMMARTLEIAGAPF